MYYHSNHWHALFIDNGYRIFNNNNTLANE